MMTCLHKWCIIFVKGGKFERSFFRINVKITETLKITLLPNHFNNKCNLENSIWLQYQHFSRTPFTG